MDIKRVSQKFSCPITDTLSTTCNGGGIPMVGWAGGVIYLPTGGDITTLTYYGAVEPGGTFVALHDSDGAAVTQTVSSAKIYELPSAIFGCGALKIVGDSDEDGAIVRMKG